MSTTITVSPARAELYAKAARHLSRRCPALKGLIKQVGPCTWLPMSDDPFTVLVRCVIYQQISTKAAKSIFDRLAAACGGLPIPRDRLAALAEADYKTCGVSGPKQRTLRAVLDHVAANPDILPGIEDRAEAELRPQLTAIKGIGNWSVDMFLMFGLGRSDVLPVGDLGLRAGVKRLYGLDELPSPAELLERAEAWKPYRSVATWYFWRNAGPVPQSGQGG
ncbi:MAG: DNA-3-methyladenine glycosylase [Gemmataceae bacterium]|nr:DNA-3-methyladenine glycosylase [Gemmataceae bacterium]